jgi:Major Facilitator Superfamily
MVSGPLWASGDVGFRRRAMECVHGVDGSRQRTRHVARCAILVWRRRGRRVPRIGSRHLQLAAAMHGIANGILFSGALVGGAVAFPFFQWLLGAHGWRMAFFLLGVPGGVWAFCWLFWFRDFPSEQAATSKETLRSVPIALLLRSKAMVKAMAQYFLGNFTFFICISWMFPYLVQSYSLTPGQAAKYSMVSLLSGATANWVSRFFVDLSYRSRFRPWWRRGESNCAGVLKTRKLLKIRGAKTARNAEMADRMYTACT